MPPKILTAFRLSAADIRRLRKLALKKEWSMSAVVRQALKAMAEKEGIK